MRLLLDTHTLLWHAFNNPLLAVRAREVINDPESVVLVSAASAWEIATKTRRGKLAGGRLATDFVASVRMVGFGVIPIDAQDAQDGGNLPGPHADPFDRVLAAQALRHDLVLVSNDAALDQFGVTRLWA